MPRLNIATSKLEKCPTETIRSSGITLFPEVDSDYNDTRDFFGPTTIVKNLHSNNFHDFIKNKDVSLVVFYDPYDPDSRLVRQHMDTASVLTVRNHHGYGAVNCLFDRDLCYKEGIEATPNYKMYSRGKYVATIRDFESFTARAMVKLVEACPVLDQAVCAKLPCDANA